MIADDHAAVLLTSSAPAWPAAGPKAVSVSELPDHLTAIWPNKISDSADAQPTMTLPSVADVYTQFERAVSDVRSVLPAHECHVDVAGDARSVVCAAGDRSIAIGGVEPSIFIW